MDDRVMVGRLFDFAVEKVPELARDIGGVQRPVAAVPKGGQSFPLGVLTAADRERVPLRAARPLFLRSSLQEETEFGDALALGKALDEALRAAAGRGRTAPFMFVDASDLGDGYRLAGRYALDGDAVAATVNVFRGQERLGRVKAAGGEGGAGGARRQDRGGGRTTSGAKER